MQSFYSQRFSTPGPSHFWNRRAGIAAGFCVLAALSFGLYYPALRAQLVADDFSLVGQVNFADAAAYFHKTSGFGRNEYRPLTVMSYAIDRRLWQANPEGYHLTNLLLHAITAGLWFLTIYALGRDFALALLGGALFVIHPVNDSRVIWISARDGPICTMFLAGALWVFILSRQKSSRMLRAIAIVLSACALLAYEGAIILPALLFAIEFLFFANGPLRPRLASCLRTTAAFWGLAAAYLCFWLILFHGSIGGYDLSLGPLAIAKNYARLFSGLLYGAKQWVFAILYVALLVSSYRVLIARWRITAFGAWLVPIAFLPYCFTNGFAFRFAYVSALGAAMLFALCILGGLRSRSRLQQAAAAGIGIVLCGWYLIQDRKIVADWITAGQIATRIPETVRTLHPNLPAGAVLVFTGIPLSYGKAQLFQTGFDAAIQREYTVPIVVRQYRLPPPDLPAEARSGAFVFEYRGGRQPLREITPPLRRLAGDTEP